ncbi:MAG: hypothetical protein EOM31_02585 [Bacteroidia bacterium]|nr:hypothetical protein [Bacteroidia bacterium]
MKTKKQSPFFLLLLVSIFMLAVPVIPHHHHADGMICMKQDEPANEESPTHGKCPTHEEHQSTDPCCSDHCASHLIPSTPSGQPDSAPQHVFIAILFTDDLLRDLFKPEIKRLDAIDVYQEILHHTDFSHAFSLRAPPVSSLS